MPLAVGTATPSSYRVGTVTPSKIYQGTTQVWPTPTGSILVDPCENFTYAPWVTAGTPTIAAARTGNGFSIPSGNTNTVSYDLPVGVQTADITFGAWVRFSVLPGGLTAPWVSLRSDAGATSHCEVRISSDGSLAVFRGATSLGGAVASGIVVNTWCFLEVNVRLSDTVGTVIVKVNGTTILNRTNEDTKNAGTKTVFDQVRLHGQASTGTWLVDDVYLRNDSGFTFTPTKIVFPGINGNYLNVPSSTALDLPGNVEIVARVSLVDWTPSAVQTIVARDNGVSPNRSWWFQVYTSGAVQVAVFYGGGTSSCNAYSSILGFTDGVMYWVKATVNISTGAIAFYTAADQATEPTTWTASGTATSATGTPIAGTQGAQCGARANGSTGPMTGQLRRFILRNGIGGPAVLDIDDSLIGNPNATTFLAATGQTVTAISSAGQDVLQPGPIPAMFVFPGVAGNYLSVPDAANLNISGDIEIVVRASLTDWTPAANSVLVSKTVGAGNRSWYLMIAAGGIITFNVSVDGTNSANGGSTAPGFTDGSMQWIKVTRVASSGLISFYTAADSPTEPASWTARGTSSQTAGALATSTTPIHLGQNPNNTSPMTGRVARVIVRNGIAGTTVLDVNESNVTDPALTSFVATTGQTVTETGNVIQPA